MTEQEMLDALDVVWELIKAGTQPEERPAVKAGFNLGRQFLLDMHRVADAMDRAFPPEKPGAPRAAVAAFKALT